VRWRMVDGDWQTAENGQQLVAGSALETRDDASALLRLADGSKIVLAPNTQLSLDALTLYAGGLMADTRMRLQRGQTTVGANPEQRENQHLRIETPSAQAVVRGTHFRLGADAEVTREETLGGLVGVSGAGKAVRVPAGSGTIARAGEAPIDPVPLLAAADVFGLAERASNICRCASRCPRCRERRRGRARSRRMSRSIAYPARQVGARRNAHARRPAQRRLRPASARH
jgi:hypothetical protein